jgi:ABC-type uncharacterized transport system auxiliary subunit
VSEIAKALDASVSGALAEIVDWTFETGEAAKKQN